MKVYCDSCQAEVNYGEIIEYRSADGDEIFLCDVCAAYFEDEEEGENEEEGDLCKI